MSNTGKVVGVGAGTTAIIATVDGDSAVCQVTVKEKTVTDIPETTKIPQATGIELDKTTIEVSVGTVENLIATIKGETADTIRWESGDETIAVVSNTGKVVAVSAGTTIVTATVDEVSVSCIVNASDTRLTLNKQKYTLYTAGRKKVSLKALLNGEDLKETDVSWYSSDSEVAKVNSSGVVTAGKKGKTTITAIDSNGLMATCTITIKKPAIKVKTKSVVTLKKGKTLKISATSTPGGKFTYKTSSKEIAAVSSKGVVTAKKKGNAYITISRNGVKNRIKVVVK